MSDNNEQAMPPVEVPCVETAPVDEIVPAPSEEAGELSFQDLPLSDEVQQAIRIAGYEKPTAVQSQIIPHMLSGRDVLAQSQTGTGKTAAFALPILSRLCDGGRKPRVLVLAPTRELAIQVANSFSGYAKFVPGFSIVPIYGGQDYQPQLKQLRRGVQVVVGTPGRVIDHINRGTLDLSDIECLVLDEADEMLNMGFLEDVQFVLERTPQQRQIALFSATLPGPIRKIAQQYLNDPVKITIKKKTMTAESIRQRALFVASRDKIDVLARILEAEETDGVIVFTKTKLATMSIAETLRRDGLSAVALNGDMPQAVRERTINEFKAGHLDILVATDVAARGLDVSRVSHVFNFDLPHDAESYIHRVGRTGRAGRAGEAIIFLTNAQRNKLRLIERVTKQPIDVVQPPTANDINAMRVTRFKQRVTDVTAQQDLTLFKELIAELAAESGKPMEMIAAALAHIGQQGRPFLVKENAKRKQQDRDRRRDGQKQDSFSSSQCDRFDARGRQHGERDARRLGPPKSGMERYRIEVGRNDGVKPGNIVGAIANEGGIDSDFIGPIRIHESHSTIDLPEGMPSEIYQSLRRTWVAGKQLRLARANQEGGDTRSGGGGKHRRNGKAANKNHIGGKTFAHKKAKPSGKRGKRKSKA